MKLILASIRLPCSRVIDNPLHTALIMSMSFQTSNSGAFRSLHCLIYKVLAPSAIRSGTFTILPHPEAFVKHFFRLFSKSFSRSPSLTRAFWKAWLSYHTSQGLSTPFFSRPQLFFKAARRAAALSDSLLNIPDLPLFVNSFFPDFSIFFKIPIFPLFFRPPIA